MMDIIISMVIVGIMLSMLGMGLLIAYYGSSKTRNVGFLFLIFGAVIAYVITLPERYADVAFWNGMLAFVGGMIGGIIGIIVFLVAIIKS
jgi:prolipoprotein diacylglyceryltransferase|tara:strand:- start:183 stop:452 length:270 start_codon:yes stop_codon:yes gene_type:complete